MPKLSKRVIDALKPRTDGADLFVWDDEMPRFGVRLTAAGRGGYLIQYRPAAGGQRRLSFAKIGIATPDEARATARQLLAAVDRGEDPSRERTEYRKAPTVEELGARFLAEHVAVRCKPSTAAEYRRAVELFINPGLGTVKITDVKRADVAALHHADRHRPYQANRTLGVLSKMFAVAEVWGLRAENSNPCRGVPKYREEKRERFLSPAEFERLGATLAECERDGSESPHVVGAIRLLALTGCRLSEVLNLRWTEVRPGALALPDSKTGAKRVPIGAAAQAVLQTIPPVEGNPFVVVGAKPGTRLQDIQRPWRRIRARAGLPALRIHDLRHSYASAAVSGGESLPMIGKVLGHTQVQTTQRYAHLADDPVRATVDRISGGIAGAMGISPALAVTGKAAA